jgi:hypothetical protein
MSTEEQKKHEAAIEAWRKEAMSGYEGGDPLDGFYYEVTKEEIDTICDLARRAPAPDPRPSSELLVAAKATLAELWNCNLWFSSEDLLGEAIKAEEARGPNNGDAYECGRRNALIKIRDFVCDLPDVPKAVVRFINEQLGSSEEAREPSEVDELRAMNDRQVEMIQSREEEIEQLRKERDEAITSRNNAEKAVDEANHQLLSHRREIDEALARAEKAEARAKWLEDIHKHCQSNGDAKLRELRRIVDSNDLDTAGSVSLMVLDEIDNLLANQPRDVAIMDTDDELLRDWLDSHNPDDAMSTTTRQDLTALAILCRRALREGGK